MSAPARGKPVSAAPEPTSPPVPNATGATGGTVRAAREPRPRSRPKPAVAAARALPDDARLLDLQVVAAAANASIRTVRGWVAAGKLPVTRINRFVRVRVSDWLAFLDRMRTS